MMNSDRQEDLNYKIESIRNILKGNAYDGIEIKSQTNFSFITRGRGFIGLASVVACASLLITTDRVVLLGDNIDGPRLYEEQLQASDEVEVQLFPWDAPQQRDELLATLTEGLRIATEAQLEHELFKIRTLLTAHDQGDFRVLCLDAAHIVESFCKNITAGISEYEAAGELSKQLWSQNIEPITLLIAFDERALRYRHPVMTDKALKNYALVGICGRRNGLIVSLTRNVLLKSDAMMQEKHEKCARVNAAFWSLIKPSVQLSEVYEQGVNQYAKEGYPLEYKHHHQGGLTGFVPRELRATSDCKHVIRVNESYAFNPTLQGAKVEDTVLVTEAGIDVLTFTGNYVYIACKIDDRLVSVPTVLVLEN